MELFLFNLGRAFTPAILVFVGFLIMRAGARRQGRDYKVSALAAFGCALLGMAFVETFVFRPATGILVVVALGMVILGIPRLIASRANAPTAEEDIEGPTSNDRPPSK